MNKAPQPDILAIIPARGGSKSIPRKNVAMLGGRQLVTWTIDAALVSRHITRVVVSTEDPEIAMLGRGWGAAVRTRPAVLANDDIPSHAVVVDAVAWAGLPDVVVLAHPTSPFRSADDFDACIQLVLDGAPAAVSITRPDKHPWHMVTKNAVGHLRHYGPDDFGPRQGFPDVWALNGAIYVAAYEYWQAYDGFFGPETVGYEMPRERSIDIDEPHDLEVARAMVAYQDRRAA